MFGIVPIFEATSCHVSIAIKFALCCPSCRTLLKYSGESINFKISCRIGVNFSTNASATIDLYLKKHNKIILSMVIYLHYACKNIKPVSNIVTILIIFQ